MTSHITSGNNQKNGFEYCSSPTPTVEDLTNIFPPLFPLRSCRLRSDHSTIKEAETLNNNWGLDAKTEGSHTGNPCCSERNFIWLDPYIYIYIYIYKSAQLLAKSNKSIKTNKNPCISNFPSHVMPSRPSYSTIPAEASAILGGQYWIRRWAYLQPANAKWSLKAEIAWNCIMLLASDLLSVIFTPSSDMDSIPRHPKLQGTTLLKRTQGESEVVYSHNVAETWLFLHVE